MKQIIFILLLAISTSSRATDLMDIFQQALTNDPIYQQEELKALASKEDINMSHAALLPNADFTAQPLINNQNNSGAITADGIQPVNNVFNSIDMRLSVNQPVFNFRNFSRLSAAKLSHQAALANLNAKLQDLIIRVAEAYFNTLYSKNNLAFYRSNKSTLAKQLADAKEKYRIGKASQNDIDTAQSAFSLAESEYMTAQEQLMERQQNLTRMTTFDYMELKPLKDSFPMASPQPANLDSWINKAIKQNWSIKTHQLLVTAAREKIKQQFSAHLPVVSAEVYYDTQSFHSQNGSLIIGKGSSRQNNLTAFLNLRVPLYSGGLVTAAVRKSQYHFQIEQRQLDSSRRDTIYTVKQSYMRIRSALQKINSDKQAIKAYQSSLSGFKDRYQVGAGTIINVITQQDKLLRIQKEYNRDQYNYIIEILRLKKAAGSLSIDDLRIINSWLKKNDKRSH